MTFLADENFPRPALLVLREAGNDVRSVAEDCPGSSDEEVADICARDARVLLTFDKDFGELVFRRGLRAGLAVVLFRAVPESPLEVPGMLGSLVETGVLEPGVFCVITRDRVRIRRLPPGNNS